jgi:hypothetical protein
VTLASSGRRAAEQDEWTDRLDQLLRLGQVVDSG